jgi:hypothetical protein
MLLMIGDQVYADHVSPETLEFIRSRRDEAGPHGDEVAGFEEYAQLYREASAGQMRNREDLPPAPHPRPLVTAHFCCARTYRAAKSSSALTWRAVISALPL